jgi:hypothetical protein
MIDGNTKLSPTALEALKRIKTLKEVTKRSGFATVNEQARVLLSLSDPDILDVSAILAAERGER